MDGQDVYRVVLYARVSTDDKGQTNETQLRELKQYCNSHGYVVQDHGEAVYTDEQTGTDDKRPGLRELKGRISEGDIDYVVARNQDRISREPSDYQKFLEYCKTFRVRVRYSDNDAKPETPDGVLFDSIQQGLAKADNMKRSMATSKGMETARLKGIHLGRKMAMVWTDETETYRAQIQLEGEHRTQIVSPLTVMDCARQGMSVSKAAKLVGVSTNTLRSNLIRRGMYDEYMTAYNNKKKEKQS